MSSRPPQRFPRGSRPPGWVSALRELREQRLRRGLRARFGKLATALGPRFDVVVSRMIEDSPDWRLSVRRSSAALVDHVLVDPELPLWCAELGRLDMAYQDVLEAPYGEPMTRADIGPVDDQVIRLVPAHALVRVVTNADEIWAAMDAGDRIPAPCRRPRPRTVLVWRSELEVSHRAVDTDEAAALKAAARGIALAELWVAFAHRDNPTARAVDVLLGWIGDGVVAR